VLIRRLNTLVMHTGFWTYALIAVFALVGIALVAPVVFGQILDALAKLARAVRGG
jgi:hypothetical protein